MLCNTSHYRNYLDCDVCIEFVEQNFDSTFSFHKNVHFLLQYRYIIIVICMNKMDNKSDIYVSPIDGQDILVHTYVSSSFESHFKTLHQSSTNLYII